MNTRATREAEKIRQRAARKIEVAEIKDTYVIRQLLRNGKFAKEDITPDIIEWSRKWIKLHRQQRIELDEILARKQSQAHK